MWFKRKRKKRHKMYWISTCTLYSLRKLVFKLQKCFEIYTMVYLSICQFSYVAQTLKFSFGILKSCGFSQMKLLLKRKEVVSNYQCIGINV